MKLKIKMAAVPPPAERFKANLVGLVTMSRSITQNIIRKFNEDQLKETLDWLTISDDVLPSMKATYLVDMFLAHAPQYVEEIMEGNAHFFSDNISLLFTGMAKPIADAFHTLFFCPHLNDEQRQKIIYRFQCCVRCALNHAVENNIQDDWVQSAASKYLAKKENAGKLQTSAESSQSV
jgi:hypothetical protein